MFCSVEPPPVASVGGVGGAADDVDDTNIDHTALLSDECRPEDGKGASTSMCNRNIVNQSTSTTNKQTSSSSSSSFFSSSSSDADEMTDDVQGPDADKHALGHSTDI